MITSTDIEKSLYTTLLDLSIDESNYISSQLNVIKNNISDILIRKKGLFDKALFFKASIHNSEKDLIQEDRNVVNDLSVSLSDASNASTFIINESIETLDSMPNTDLQNVKEYHDAKDMVSNIKKSLFQSINILNSIDRLTKSISNSETFHNNILHGLSAEISSSLNLMSLVDKYIYDINISTQVLNKTREKGIDTLSFCLNATPEERMVIVNE